MLFITRTQDCVKIKNYSITNSHIITPAIPVNNYTALYDMIKLMTLQILGYLEK